MDRCHFTGQPKQQKYCLLPIHLFEPHIVLPARFGLKCISASFYAAAKPPLHDYRQKVWLCGEEHNMVVWNQMYAPLFCLPTHANLYCYCSEAAHQCHHPPPAVFSSNLVLAYSSLLYSNHVTSSSGEHRQAALTDLETWDVGTSPKLSIAHSPFHFQHPHEFPFSTHSSTTVCILV